MIAQPVAAAVPDQTLPVIRVLVVDDSAYMRWVITQTLEQAADLEVVGTARDGVEALKLIPELEPDVITLDVEMPRLDGLDTVREIMVRYPRPVVMLSSHTAAGARATIQALSYGAVDFVEKPSARAHIALVMGEVISKVRLAARMRTHALRVPRTTPLAPAPSPTAEKSAPRTALNRRGKLVVLGASTGGPNALSTVLSGLPANLPATLLMVQHMPVGFTAALAERLNALSPLAIREAENGLPLEMGTGLLAPAGYHLTLDAQHQIVLTQTPPLHGVRPAVDVTLLAAAAARQHNTIGVILTGMGNDGTQGAVVVRSAGGQVIVQDEASSVVWGMPRSVVEAGAANQVVPLKEVAAAICQAIEN